MLPLTRVLFWAPIFDPQPHPVAWDATAPPGRWPPRRPASAPPRGPAAARCPRPRKPLPRRGVACSRRRSARPGLGEPGREPGREPGARVAREGYAGLLISWKTHAYLKLLGVGGLLGNPYADAPRHGRRPDSGVKPSRTRTSNPAKLELRCRNAKPGSSLFGLVLAGCSDWFVLWPLSWQSWASRVGIYGVGLLARRLAMGRGVFHTLVHAPMHLHKKDHHYRRLGKITQGYENTARPQQKCKEYTNQ